MLNFAVDEAWPRARPRLDLVGLRFGRLTVLARAGKDKFGRSTWRCRCDCGKEKIARHGLLESGHVRSCGCLSKLYRGHTRHGTVHRIPARSEPAVLKAFDQLGLDGSADFTAVKARFRLLAKQFHPDKNCGSKEHEAKLREVIVAYTILKSVIGPRSRNPLYLSPERLEEIWKLWEKAAARNASSRPGILVSNGNGILISNGTPRRFRNFGKKRRRQRICLMMSSSTRAAVATILEQPKRN